MKKDAQPMKTNHNLRLLYRITAAGVMFSTPSALRAQHDHEGHSHGGHAEEEGPKTLGDRIEPMIGPALIIVALAVFLIIRNSLWRKKMGI